jgi:hypothetical protein
LKAAQADEDVVGTSRVRELERRVRELERLLGRKTMEVEILKEALDVARVKKPSLQLPSWNGRKDGYQGSSRHTRGRPLKPDRAGERGRQAAPALSQGRGRAPIGADPPAGGRASDLRVPAHYATGEPAAKGRKGSPISMASGRCGSCRPTNYPGTTHRAAARAHARPHRDRPALECSLVLRSLRACLPQRRNCPRIVRHRRLRSGDHRLVGRPRASPARWCAT